MLSMCPMAWYIFMWSIRLSCLMLLAAILLMLRCSGSMMDNYELYMTAVSLRESTQALLLTAVLFSALIEDAQS